MPGSVEPLDLVGAQIPYHFMCPISLDLMLDPVTVSTGQTYDRPSIDSWLATGNTTCPVTRSPLTDLTLTLIPNHNLRRLIQDWCVSHLPFGIERIPSPKQPADLFSVRSLLSQLSSSSTTPSRLAALRRLRSLARVSDENRSLLASLGARQALLSILFSSPNHPDLALESLAVLSLLQLVDCAESDCAAIASDPDKVSLLARLLFHPSSIEVRVNSAALIGDTVAGTQSQELQAQVSIAEGIFEGVVALLRDAGAAYPRAAKIGLRALFALCLVKQTRHLAVAAGAPEALVDSLADFSSGAEVERALALATVKLLCRVPSGCAAFAAHELSVPVLVKAILKFPLRAAEYAAGALLSLCTAVERCQWEAMEAGVLTQLLLLLQSNCTRRAKKKAQMLLKLLRDSWPDDAAGKNFDDFAYSEVQKNAKRSRDGNGAGLGGDFDTQTRPTLSRGGSRPAPRGSGRGSSNLLILCEI